MILLLFDEFIDNFDVLSVEVLEDVFEVYDGTVLVVIYDWWFVWSFDWFLVFGVDGVVYELSEFVFDEVRVVC